MKLVTYNNPPYNFLYNFDIILSDEENKIFNSIGNPKEAASFLFKGISLFRELQTFLLAGCYRLILDRRTVPDRPILYMSIRDYGTFILYVYTQEYFNTRDLSKKSEIIDEVSFL